MPDTAVASAARAEVRDLGADVGVLLGGTWSVAEPRPVVSELMGPRTPQRVRVRAEEVERWDSSLLLFLQELQRWCAGHGAEFDATSLPPKVRQLLEQFLDAREKTTGRERSESFLAAVGNATVQTVRQGSEIARFIGECVLGARRVAAEPKRFRWRDCLGEMQQCGAMALPIVSLIAFLIGVTLAYMAAIVLRQFGGDIYVADLIGLAMVREMGAVMTGVVLAGRTGAAFAATLGNMKMNEEIDALETLGISAVQFLVLPRLLALWVMMPLLAMYANALGILGGMVVAFGLLSISPTAYWVEMLTIVDLSDIVSGVIKAGAFGLIVGIAGCLRGLQADRSAAGVGRAATSAVVTAILLMVVADAIFAVLFNVLGI